MEKSSSEFLTVPGQFIHHRNISYSSGVRLPETADITYVSLDTFRSTVQNINTEIAAWLTFLSKNDPKSVLSLVARYPQFLSCYQDIAAFRQKPEELIYMFSEALYIMDKNAERLMVDELQEQLTEEHEKNEALQKQVNTTNAKLKTTSVKLDKATTERDAALARVAELEQQLAAK